MNRLVLMLVLLAVTAPSYLPSATVWAQSCPTIDPPCPPDDPPGFAIDPAEGTFSSAELTVTIYVWDDNGLVADSWRVWHNGVPVTGSFPLALGSTRTDGSARGTIQLQGTTNTLAVQICDNAATSQCSSGSVSYTYEPPPPPPEKAVPVVSLAPHNDQYRVASLCAACVDAVLAYSTPEYRSLDATRSVNLFYSSAQGYPRALVQVDAFDNSTTPPEKMSLQVVDGSGNTVAENFYWSGNGTNRLAAQFDARSLATGAYTYTAVVRSWWGSEYREASLPVRVLIVNERTSPYGAGWSIAGLQRIHLGRADGALVITEGDGSIGFWARQSCDGTGNCTYLSPHGDFSEVRFEAASGKFTRRYPDGMLLTFSGSSGRLESAVDRFGNRTSYNYDGSGRLGSITDPVSATLTFGYHSDNGKLATVQDPGGRITRFEFDNGGPVLNRVVGPDGVVALRVSYDVEHRVMTYWDRTGAQTDLTYDAYGTLATITGAQVATTDAGLLRPVTSVQSLERAMLPGSGTGSSATPAIRVLTDSVRSTVTSPRGAKSSIYVHRSGAPSRVEERDANGQLQVSTWTRNDHGQPTAAMTPGGGSFSYTWSAYNITRIKNQRGGTQTDIQYGSYGRPESVWVNGTLVERNFFGRSEPRHLDSTRVDTSVTHFTWDTRGRLLTRTDPDGHRTTIGYESGGMQNTRTVTLGGGGSANRTTTFAYDVHGRTASVTDALGHVFSTTYDPINRVTSTTEPGPTTTTYGHDDVNRTYSVTDAELQVYRTVRNALGWVESETDPRNAIERFAYDRNGNVTIYTNRRSQEVRFTYDTLDRVLTRTADGQTTTFAYAPDATWMAAANGESTDTLWSDPSGRPNRAVTVRNGIRYVLEWTHNDEGLNNAVQVERPGAWSREIGFGYDAVQRLNWMKDMAAKVSSVSYTKDELPKTVTLPTGTSTSRLQQSWTYTAAHRPKALALTQGLDSKLGRRYSYDALERVSTITRGQLKDLYGYRDEVVRTLQYDALGRLSYYKDVHHWGERGDLVCLDPWDMNTCYYETINHADLLREETYTYDGVGNRTDKGAVIETGNRIVSFDGYTLEYDADGNLTRKYKSGVIDQYLTWNSLGQLMQVVTNGATTTFGYDAWGRRVRKTTGATTIRYVHDGDDLIMELDGNGMPLREYTYYPGTDRPHSVRRTSDGAIFYYTTEEPGHVTGLVSASNALVNRYEYTPFGADISATEQVAQPLRYAAREYDPESRLYYHRSRHYDPLVGRFISEDPIGLAGGMNPFVYVGNDPANSRDPFGLSREELAALCPSGTELHNYSVDGAGNERGECKPKSGGSAGWYDYNPFRPGRGSSYEHPLFSPRVAGPFGAPPPAATLMAGRQTELDGCPAFRIFNTQGIFGVEPASYRVVANRILYLGGTLGFEELGVYRMGIRVTTPTFTARYLGLAQVDCASATYVFGGVLRP